MQSEPSSELSVLTEPPIAKGAVQLYLTGVFMLLGIIAPVCMFLGVRGFAPVVGVAGLACLPFARPLRRDWMLVGLLALLVAWAGLSASWSLFSPGVLTHAKDFRRFTALHLALQLVLCGGLVFSAARLNRIMALRALVWIGFGLLLGALLLTSEMFSGAAIYSAMMRAYGQPIRPDLAVRNLAQGGYIVAVLFWPVGLGLCLRRGTLGAVALAAFVPLSTFLFRGDAPSIALALSVPVFFLVLKVGPPGIVWIGTLVVLYFLLTPWVMLALQNAGVFTALHSHLPASWQARLNIWAFATQTFLHSPLRGLGLDSSRAFPDLIKLHPHNSALQLWFELGAIGAALGAAFWAGLFRRIAIRAHEERLLAAIATATATVYLTIGALSFGLWQEWWLCLGALSLAACILARPLALAVRGDLPQAAGWLN